MNKVMNIAIVSAIMSFMGTVGEPAEAGDSFPEGLRGFSGQVRGVVVEKGERNTFTFKVARVLRVWKNNKAETPKLLAGRTVPVGPRWQKGDGGKWRPVELHVAFIKKLKAGQEVTLEIQNVERSHFSILELSNEQRQLVRSKHEKSDRPTDRKTDTDRNTEAEIRKLKTEVRQLRAEVAELRRLFKEKNY